MKIVLTGASGFVGRQIVPILAARASLLLVGRNVERLRKQYPDLPCCGYDDLAREGNGADLIVHLAVANTNAALSESDVRQANVTHLEQTLAAAQRAGIARFVNISSTHALDDGNRSPYAKTKREALKVLAEARGIAVSNIFLPAVYGTEFAGKLAILNSLPSPARRFGIVLLSALKPTVRAETLAHELLQPAPSPERILSEGQNSNAIYLSSKRIIDLTASLTVIALLWWLFAIVWFAVRSTSAGPGIFAQERIGCEGRRFTCYKFRTMMRGTPNVATNEVSAHHVTTVGAFLRRTKLDELPQVWNIIRNEMSLVGPRPCLPNQTELIEARRACGVLKLKPGITGLAQVNGIDMSVPSRLAAWDARYAALRSLILDSKILIATATGRGQGDKVRQIPDHG